MSWWRTSLLQWVDNAIVGVVRWEWSVWRDETSGVRGSLRALTGGGLLYVRSGRSSSRTSGRS